MSERLFEYAREAKSFMQDAGEIVMSDELIMRAVVAYDQMERHGMIAADDVDRAFSRAHAIALIAHNFDTRCDDTPKRRALFAHEIGDPMRDVMREAVTTNRRLLGMD